MEEYSYINKGTNYDTNESVKLSLVSKDLVDCGLNRIYHVIKVNVFSKQ